MSRLEPYFHNFRRSGDLNRPEPRSLQIYAFSDGASLDPKFQEPTQKLADIESNRALSAAHGDLQWNLIQELFEFLQKPDCLIPRSLRILLRNNRHANEKYFRSLLNELRTMDKNIYDAISIVSSEKSHHDTRKKAENALKGSLAAMPVLRMMLRDYNSSIDRNRLYNLKLEPEHFIMATKALDYQTNEPYQKMVTEMVKACQKLWYETQKDSRLYPELENLMGLSLLSSLIIRAFIRGKERAYL